MNQNKITKKAKKPRFSILRKTVSSAIAAAAVTLHSSPALAAGRVMALDINSDVTGKIERLFDLLATVTASAGGIILLIGIGKFALSLMGRQTDEQGHTVYMIIGGIIMGAAGVIAKFLLA